MFLYFCAFAVPLPFCLMNKNSERVGLFFDSSAKESNFGVADSSIATN